MGKKPFPIKIRRIEELSTTNPLKILRKTLPAKNVDYVPHIPPEDVNHNKTVRDGFMAKGRPRGRYGVGGFFRKLDRGANKFMNKTMPYIKYASSVAPLAAMALGKRKHSHRRKR